MNKIRPNLISVYIYTYDIIKMQTKYLLLKRCGKYLPGIWQIVTGKIDGEESTVDAAFREVNEETGIYLTELVNVDVMTFFDPTKDQISISANFLANVDKTTNVQLSLKEHSEFIWATYEEAKKMIFFPEQKLTLEKIENYFIKQNEQYHFHKVLRTK